MKKLACALALALAPTLALAAEKPDWAFPITEKEQPAPRIPGDSPGPELTRQCVQARLQELFVCSQSSRSPVGAAWAARPV